jgi:hypothetical protein
LGGQTSIYNYYYKYWNKETYRTKKTRTKRQAEPAKTRTKSAETFTGNTRTNKGSNFKNQ